MSFTRTFFSLSLLSQTALAGLYPGMTNVNHTCTLVPNVLSCSDGAQADLVDSCCVETFGGLVMQTQYWNTYTGLESKGQVLPKDTWTIHGLWPDFCNGSYTQYCDLSRQYDPEPYPNTTTGTADGEPVVPWEGPSIDKMIKQFKRWDLIEYMKKYWIGLDQESSVLWSHEYSKHATCFSSFDLECYGPLYQKHEEIVEFFETVVLYYQRLPTWKWLADAGVVPSNSTGYSIGDFQAALQEGYGELPYIGCTGPKYNETEAGKGSDDNGATVLNEMWYYMHVYGRPQRGESIPVAADSTGGRLTNCAKASGAIWYYERTAAAECDA